MLERRVLLSANVLTYHNDPASTGQNLAETQLTPANVNVTQFAKRFSQPVDGQVYAQPLYVSGVNITTGAAQGIHNVVYVATEHDSLYAIDGNNGQVLWQDSFLVPDAQLQTGGATVNVTTVPAADVNSTNVNPEIGITGTPAIDSAANALFVAAKTKQVVTSGTTSNTHYVYTLNRVNLQDGSYTSTVIGDTISNNLSTYAYRTASDPYVIGTGAGAISVTVNGKTQSRVYFNTLRQMNRPGLTLYNGSVYIAFASHGDNDPYHGWILGYKETDLSATAVLNTTPNGSRGGIWQSGGTLAMDSDGFMYVETGNGSFANTSSSGVVTGLNAAGFPTNGNYGDSFVKIGVDTSTTATNQNVNGWGLKVADYFTPMNQFSLNNADEDLGSGAPIVLPDSVGSTAHPHLLVGAGKEGKIYLIDRDHMGGFSSNTDAVVQEIGAAIGGGGMYNGSYSTPAFFFDGTTARIYYGGQQDVARSFPIANAAISPVDAKTPDKFGAHGSTPSISANGASNGIVWDLEFDTSQLRAYDAINYANELWTSAQAGARDQLGGHVLFAVPTIANGEVFVGTSNALVGYGLLAPPTALPNPPSNLTAAPVSNTQINLGWQDHSGSGTPNYESGIDIEQSTDGGNTWAPIATASAGATSYSAFGLTPGKSYTFRVRAFNSLGNSAYSNTASATTPNLTPVLDLSGGFANSAGVITPNGSAKLSGANLELTDGNGNEAGSAFTQNTMLVQRFTTSFKFKLTSAVADGFTFTIQGNGPTALGGGGGGLGYVTMKKSVAVKFDIYDNSGEGTDSTGLFVNGDNPTVFDPTLDNPADVAVDMSSSGVQINSGDTILATLHYDGTTLLEAVTDTVTGKSFATSYAVNIPSLVGGNSAYIGFTGGTGGLAAVQNILNWTYTPLPAPPAALMNLTVTPASGTELDVSWSETSTPVDYFTILRKGASDATFSQLGRVAGATTVYMDGGLTPNSTFSYEVVASNAGGDSVVAGPVSGTTPIAPLAPTNVQVTNITTSAATLTWQNNATNAIGYKITRQLASNESIPVATLPATATSYTDHSLLPGSPYQYIVAAFNLAGPSDGVDVSFQTVALPPAGLTASGGADQVTLNWAASTGATRYNIYRGTSSGAEAATPIATNVSGTTFTDTGLTAGTTYYYQITAIDGGGESAASAETFSKALLPGDADGDGKVDFADLVIVARNYGTTTGATYAMGDFNSDGKIDFSDLVMLARYYGQSVPSTTAVAAAQPLTAGASINAQVKWTSDQPFSQNKIVSRRRTPLARVLQ